MEIEVPGGSVGCLTDGPHDARATLVLAHGAGAGMEHPFMQAVAEGLGSRGIKVVRFNFLYAQRGKRAPDRASVLESTFGAVVDAMEGGPHFLGGKSMGGRIASHLVAAGDPCPGLVFLGYPLHPPGKPERMRDEHLYGIDAPMLFVEGTRDSFCPLGTLETVRAKLPRSELLVVEDGDHSFRVRRSSGRSDQEALEGLISGVAGWILDRR